MMTDRLSAQYSRTAIFSDGHSGAVHPAALLFR